MPFDSTADYYNPWPGFNAGLQIGHQVAQQRYQDQATKIAERRTAIEEQNARRQEVRAALEADRIQKELDAEAAFKSQFSSALNEELAALPPEKRGMEEEIQGANRRAYAKSVPYLPPHMLQQSMQQAETQAGMDRRAEKGVQGKLDLLNARLDSQEYIAELRNDAKTVSEDEYVNRHLNAHAKQSGLPMMQADADLRRIYRANHPKAGAASDSTQMPEPDGTPDTLGQLERARDAGVKRVKVTKQGDVQVMDHFWQGDPIEDVIKKVERDEKIKGRQPAKQTSAPSDSPRRVFQYDPKTGGIKK